MSLSDVPFPYGPFVPHHVPKQYIEHYFAAFKADKFLVLNTTVEDVSRAETGNELWALTLRQYDAVEQVDRWWKEEFDAVIIANGHYSVPFVPSVKGLEAYIEKFPGRVIHSKSYRTAHQFANRKVLVIGNSASGHDVTVGVVETARLPIYQSRRSPSRWDGAKPDAGVEWKPIVKEYLETGEILFDDGTILDDIDVVIYCTGYKVSFPFWNSKLNGRPLFDYKQNRLIGNYLHTFLTDFTTIGIIGIPRTLTFRSFNYQAIALARIFSGRNALPLPTKDEQRQWEEQRWQKVSRQHLKFHDIAWDNGETMDYLRELYEIAGLPRIEGQGQVPPILDAETRWAIKHVKKYPVPGGDQNDDQIDDINKEWTIVERGDCKDSLHFL